MTDPKGIAARHATIVSRLMADASRKVRMSLERGRCPPPVPINPQELRDQLHECLVGGIERGPERAMEFLAIMVATVDLAIAEASKVA